MGWCHRNGDATPWSDQTASQLRPPFLTFLIFFAMLNTPSQFRSCEAG